MSNKFENRSLYSDSESLEIPINKSKVIGMVLGSLLFVILGFWFVFYLATNQTRYSPLLIQIIGIFALLFFGLTLMYGIKKFFDKKPGLIFNKQGIIDNSSGTSVGLIEWNDITQIRIIEIIKTKSIALDTDKPEKYIEKAKSFQAKIMRANYNSYGTPLFIAPQTLKINFDDLYDLILEELSKNKK